MSHFQLDAIILGGGRARAYKASWVIARNRWLRRLRGAAVLDKTACPQRAP